MVPGEGIYTASEVVQLHLFDGLGVRSFMEEHHLLK